LPGFGRGHGSGSFALPRRIAPAVFRHHIDDIARGIGRARDAS
jgi:hypothetical protein